MRQNAFERPDVAQTAIVHLGTLVALVLLGWVLSYWTWAWLAPSSQPRLPQAAETSIRPTAALTLFGGSQAKGGAAAPASSTVKLLGVAAATGGLPGYAVVQIGARGSLTVREGEDAAPGIHLEEVHPDHVILVRNGVRETLAWPRKTASPLIVNSK